MEKRSVAKMMLVAAIVVGGLSAGFASASKYTEKPVSVEKKAKMKDALKDRMKKVYADLRKDGKIPNDFLIYDYHSINQAKDSIRNSALHNINEHGLQDTYIPPIFVKPDGTEYAIGYKKANGDNEIVHYKLQDGVFVEFDSVKSKGIAFGKSLDELTQ